MHIYYLVHYPESYQLPRNEVWDAAILHAVDEIPERFDPEDVEIIAENEDRRVAANATREEFFRRRDNS